jgi:dienelactone hydrolase
MPLLPKTKHALRYLVLILFLGSGLGGEARELDVPVPKDSSFGVFPGKHGEIVKVPIRLSQANSRDRVGSVLIVHGCNGPDGPSYLDWARFLSRNGFNAIEVNLFRERGLLNSCADGLEVSLTSRSSAREIEAAANWVKNQPWSNGKVGVIGFSMGGSSVLTTASLALSDAPRKSGIDAAVSFYPNCRHYSTKELVIPLQIHIGKDDDWTPAEPCEQLQNFWQQAPKSFELFVYQNAHHAFDIYGLNDTFRCPRGRCTGRYDAEANKLSRERTLKFLDQHLNRP